MEIVDILVRLIDATTDRFHLQDVGICQFSVKNRNGDNSLEIVSVRLNRVCATWPIIMIHLL